MNDYDKGRLDALELVVERLEQRQAVLLNDIQRHAKLGTPWAFEALAEARAKHAENAVQLDLINALIKGIEQDKV